MGGSILATKIKYLMSGAKSKPIPNSSPSNMVVHTMLQTRFQMPTILMEWDRQKPASISRVEANVILATCRRITRQSSPTRPALAASSESAKIEPTERSTHIYQFLIQSLKILCSLMRCMLPHELFTAKRQSLDSMNISFPFWDVFRWGLLTRAQQLD
jgi:hypothetical protein